MYKMPVLTASLSVILDLAVCHTFTMRSAWLRLDVLFAAVGSCVRSLLPRVSRRITFRDLYLSDLHVDCET